jgi:hypothetical protein
MCFIVDFWSMEARRWSDVTGAHPKTSINHIMYMNENVLEDNVGLSNGGMCRMEYGLRDVTRFDISTSAARDVKCNIPFPPADFM